MKTHDHRIEPRAVGTQDRIVHGHDVTARSVERGQESCLAADEHRRATSKEASRRVRGRDDSPRGLDTRRQKPAIELVVRRRRVVRDEPHLEIRVLEKPNPVGRARNGLAREPDDPVHVAGNCSAGCHTVSVPRFEAFRALRYDPSIPLDEVTAPPYDVLDSDQRDAYGRRHERNIVHIDMPVGAAPYASAARILQRWSSDGTLVLDQRPSFTIYRMDFTDEAGRERSTVGVMGALEVVDQGSPDVLPHERTTPKDSTDRLDLTRATRANLSPVWGLSLRHGLSDLLSEFGEPVGEIRADDGVRHRLERVTDPGRIEAISAAIASHPVLIADGHHRYSISRTYRDEVRAASGRADGPEDLVLAYVAELSEPNLSVAAIHRIYASPSYDELQRLLEPYFLAEDAGPVGSTTVSSLQRRGSLCLVRPDGTGTWLSPRPGAFGGVRDLDSARLEAALDGSGAEVSYQHGVDHVLERLRKGASAAVLIRPVSVPEILRTATEGILMPPKSTFFTPKLLTGPVIRDLQSA